jgi:hypothetical protein
MHYRTFKPLLAGFLLAGCSQPPPPAQTVYVQPARVTTAPLVVADPVAVPAAEVFEAGPPPPPVVEVVPPAPFVGAVWIGGTWVVRPHGWVWVRGHWR